MYKKYSYSSKLKIMKTRKEHDSIGSVKVPVDKYWGASTQRSSKYFDIGDFLVRPILIKSIAIIKKAAAIVNVRIRDIDKRIGKAISDSTMSRITLTTDNSKVL